ncbi:MAG: tRNA preQ1(34) S-adenosylmethionine ribosyltransferase-isomerase QueA [Pseudomonadota bacterium]|jgi:S-adenosylmethionine:tRNA ribosyltransferase-isomerase
MSVVDPYSYVLPEELIAQRPVYPPESARMMVINRADGAIKHSSFAEITSFLRPGDHLVFNETKVIPARLFGNLESSSGQAVEVMLLSELSGDRWVAIGYPMRKIRQAQQIVISEQLIAEVLASESDDRLLLKFRSLSDAPVARLLDEVGTMPIPPYIRDGRGDERDLTDYQSIFARNPGSVAAPTASLHFSDPLVEKITGEARCVIERITLHVGAASFQPVIVNGELRPPGEERLEVPDDVMLRLTNAKRDGHRVIAVGTTVVRALESAARGIRSNATTLFIQPGFEFKLVDALVTNFHQPGTTHLLLVEALLARDNLSKAYSAAVSNSYRFLSYGDGMLII